MEKSPRHGGFSHGKSLNEHDVFDDFPSSIARSRGPEGGAEPFSSRAGLFFQGQGSKTGHQRSGILVFS